MFRTISALVPTDGDYDDPERVHRLGMYQRVLDGKLYDLLPHDFHEEKNASGEYIPLRDRAPCARYALCRTVVEDSVSLLFGEGRFPRIECADKATREALADLVKERRLNEVMAHAAILGSVGSVAILLRILRGKVFFEVLKTQFFTPEYDPEEPDTLLRVVEKRKVRGKTLAATGYTIPENRLEAEYWFMREWNAQAETWYEPFLVHDPRDGQRDAAPRQPQVDEKRTVQHGFGFVPMVWVKNLPGGDGVDGYCTFKDAIESSIEIDYQLSQSGRGLKYSSDPTMLIKDPANPDPEGGGQLTGGAASALVVGPDGDAKLLEIDGTASQAVIEYVRFLRELALESIHGNRANADRLSAAQSGRAMELLNQGLVWLADRLRIAYGEHALLALMNMVVRVSQQIPLTIKGRANLKLSQQEQLSLRWSPWFAPSYADQVELSNALRTNVDARIMSVETAVKALSTHYDVEDIDAEITQIRKDREEAIKYAGMEAAKVTINKSGDAAG